VTTLSRQLKNEDQTIAFGHELSLFARAGLTICLFGDLGAGKSTLARSFIRSLCPQGQSLDVPSPTFALVQPYDDLRVRVHHFDLYRTHDIDEVYELGLYDDLDTRVTLIEWPERIADDLPDNRIELYLTIEDEQRVVSVHSFGTAQPIVERLNAVTAFLTKNKWETATRRFLQGDASARRYERLVSNSGQKAILMDMPAMPDGPLLSSGKTYSATAHIAEGIFPVAAINDGLLQVGLSAPKALAKQLEQGLMLIEDFGDDVYGNILAAGGNILEPMTAATKLLAHMSDIDWPNQISIGTRTHHISNYGAPAYAIEVDLLLSWFWPLLKGNKPSDTIRKDFHLAWERVFQLFCNGTNNDIAVWVLRDFHSPNLIWLPDRKENRKVGLIDTQDCVLGHPAYDLVSMLQDARVDLPTGTEEKLYSYYCTLRSTQNRDFNQTHFSASYAGLGAQRATKILGIFARLYVRDNKPAYLKHLPRVSKYLEDNLKHPALKELADWFSSHLPSHEREYKGPTI